MDSTNEVWVGNEKGLIHFNHKKFQHQYPTTNPMISDIFLGGKSLIEELPDLMTQPFEEIDQLTLPENYNSVGFQFVDITTNSSSRHHFHIKLDGRDSIWKSVNQNEVFYTALEPGKYKFNVGMDDQHGQVDLLHVQSLDLVISSDRFISWWTTIPILTLLLLSGGVYSSLKRKTQKEEEENIQTNEKYELSNLDKQASHETLQIVEHYLKKTQAYLKPDITITDIAEELNIHHRYISQAINENLNQGFPFFINSYRIEEVKRRLKDPEFKKYTLVAIAESCGIKSKSTFNRSFKKVTGKTPSEYLAIHQLDF